MRYDKCLIWSFMDKWSARQPLSTAWSLRYCLMHKENKIRQKTIIKIDRQNARLFDPVAYQKFWSKTEHSHSSCTPYTNCFDSSLCFVDQFKRMLSMFFFSFLKLNTSFSTYLCAPLTCIVVPVQWFIQTKKNQMKKLLSDDSKVIL